MYRALVQSAPDLLGSIAGVNTRLYRQLLDQQRPDVELALIRRAYDLAAALYSASYQANGRPMTAHVVSVASALTLIGMPSHIVAGALVHNVYVNGDFGDGLHRATTPARRRRVIQAVGSEVEGLIERFSQWRLTDRLPLTADDIAAMSQLDRMILTIDLADVLDKYVDMNLLYAQDSEWISDFVDAHEAALIQLAHRLDQPVLAHAMALAFEQVRSNPIPDTLVSKPGSRYARQIVPSSWVVRPSIRWTQRIKGTRPWRFARRLIRGA